MAPAGSFAAMKAAINAGCDSIYFGVEQLNMRARSSYNFKIEELREIGAGKKEAGIKAYITLNTILYEHDITLMRKIIDEAKTAGIDAIIVADIAAMQYASEVGMPIHASTQLSISNYDSVKFFARFADTMVLARELDLKMIEDIAHKIQEDQLKGPSGELVKIEVFGHGALCIAPSGRCQMSIIQTNTSAQRGACLQECRKKYRLIDDDSGTELRVENEYILSPQDLCCLPFLDKVIAAGVNVLKIEGRGRSPQYVDTVIRVYREAIDAIYDESDMGRFNQQKIAEWMERLKSEYNRGFCEGYFMGKKLPEWSGYSGNRSSDERVFAGLVNHYFPKAGVAEIKLQASSLKKGDRLVIMGNTTGVVYGNADSIMENEIQVDQVKNPSLVTVPIKDPVRRNDKVYLLKLREAIV